MQYFPRSSEAAISDCGLNLGRWTSLHHDRRTKVQQKRLEGNAQQNWNPKPALL
jgi:hypothetical protein